MDTESLVDKSTTGCMRPHETPVPTFTFPKKVVYLADRTVTYAPAFVTRDLDNFLQSPRELRVTDVTVRQPV